MSRRSWIAGLGALALAACGYTFGTGLPQRGVRTVHLVVVGNDTFRQRLEVELSRALARELPATTDLVQASADAADAVLEVSLKQDRERTLVTGSRQDPVREGAFEAAVHIRLCARQSGEVLIERDLLDRAEFRDPIGEDLTSARKELVDDLARKIALALETGF